jgi:hypothetical protein
MGRGKSATSKGIIRTSYDILKEINPASVRAVCYRLFTMGVIRAAHLRRMVRSCIERHIDIELLERTRLIERVERETLREIAEQYPGGTA